MVQKLSRKGASMTTATVPSRTRAPDYNAIVRVVHLYSDAFGANDVTMFEEAFHEDAWIFYTGEDGTLTSGPIRDCFEDWALPAMGRAIGRVISVIQAGDIATVLLGWDRPDDMANSYVDMHNLIRQAGAWKITNKTATHTSRAGGA
jgi:ketosteroid isomerase-like protein